MEPHTERGHKIKVVWNVEHPTHTCGKQLFWRVAQSWNERETSVKPLRCCCCVFLQYHLAHINRNSYSTRAPELFMSHSCRLWPSIEISLLLSQCNTDGHIEELTWLSERKERLTAYLRQSRLVSFSSGQGNHLSMPFWFHSPILTLSSPVLQCSCV